MIEVARRSFLTGLGAALIAAPAIVRAGSLMPVRQMVWNADEIAALLDARLNVGEYEGDATFYRYSGYETIHVDKHGALQIDKHATLPRVRRLLRA